MSLKQDLSKHWWNKTNDAIRTGNPEYLPYLIEGIELHGPVEKLQELVTVVEKED